MNARDRAILADLRNFRALTRTQIITLHFGGLKNAVASCNHVLLRLRRQGRVKAVTDRQEYVYMAADTQIKPDSTKLPHFLRIADFYIDCAKYEDPALFTVEPRVGAKGSVEPDVFMIWKNAPFYVEIQRTQYSARVFSDKLARYERHYNGGDWRNYEWQPADGALFPHVWIVGATQYDVGGTPFNVLQSRSVGELFALT